jgi:hypothetical protein
MLQTLQMVQNKRIHILNLGFNSSWIIKSFEKTRPDRVYLVRKEKENEKAIIAEKEIKKFAKKKNIEILQIFHEGDLYSLIKNLKKIIINEKDNFIYLGVSSGNRDNLSAFILSSMIFSKYPKEIMLYSLRGGDYLELPKVKVKIPKKEIIESLKFINKKEKCKKKDLRDFLFEKKILEIGKKSKFKGHGQYVKLNRSILDPALEWGLIKTEGKRRGCLIYLTQEGKKWIKLL